MFSHRKPSQPAKRLKAWLDLRWPKALISLLASFFLLSLLSQTELAAQTAKPLEPKAASAEPLSATKPSSPAAAIAAIGPTIAAKAWIL
ncbi:MAG: hypothetical protein EBX61_07715, partial [Betaproteobacteria bacterium]|nr:hypothetical protein [Betaproteobacteria bacterium]